MTDLKTWIEQAGRGAKTRLARKAEVSPATVCLAMDGKLTRPDIAVRIAEATGGQVDPLSLLSASALAKPADGAVNGEGATA